MLKINFVIGIDHLVVINNERGLLNKISYFIFRRQKHLQNNPQSSHLVKIIMTIICFIANFQKKKIRNFF